MNRRTFLTHTGIALGGVICTSGCSSTRKVERSPSLLASLAAATAIMVSADVAGVAPPESGIREITIDAGQVTGRIRSLLGVNRGPLSWPREPDRPTVSHMESYRRFGLDFIRTHDFYEPTDWHVIFPRWDADATAAASYDFTSSDERIKAIVERFIRYCAEHKVPLDFFLLDDQHRLSLVEETSDTGRDITLERPFRFGSVCLVELNTASAETKPNNPPIRPIRPGTRPQFPPDR